MKTMFALLLLSTVAQADLTLLSIGDSISTAVDTRYQFTLDLDAAGIDHTWVGDTAQPYLGGDYDYQGRGGWKFSHMLSGDAVQDGLIDALTRYTPDVITILGGYNNAAGNNDTIDDIEDQWDALADYAFANTNAAILVANVTDVSGQWEHRSQKVIDWNTRLASNVAARKASGQRIALVDNWSVIDNSHLAADGLHLVNSGSIIAGQGWYPALQSVPEPSAAIFLAFVGLVVIGFNKYLQST